MCTPPSALSAGERKGHTFAFMCPRRSSWRLDQNLDFSPRPSRTIWMEVQKCPLSWVCSCGCKDTWRTEHCWRGITILHVRCPAKWAACPHAPRSRDLTCYFHHMTITPCNARALHAIFQHYLLLCCFLQITVNLGPNEDEKGRMENKAKHKRVAHFRVVITNMGCDSTLHLFKGLGSSAGSSPQPPEISATRGRCF